MSPELRAWMDDAIAQIDVMVDSGLLGRPRHRAEWLGLALLGRGLGLDVLESLRAFYTTKDGAPVAFADTLLAWMRQQPLARVDIVESSNTVCCIEAQRGDAAAYRVRYELHPNMERELPGVIAANYTAGWIRGRVISVVARVVFPDVCARMIADEDLTGSDRFFKIHVGVVPVRPPAPPQEPLRPAESRADLYGVLMQTVPRGWDEGVIEAMIAAGEAAANGKESSTPAGSSGSEGAAAEQRPSPTTGSPAASEALTPHQRQVQTRTEPIPKPEQAILALLRDEYKKADHPEDVDAIASRHQESIQKLGAAAKRMAYADFQAACDRTKRAEIARRQSAGGAA